MMDELDFPDFGGEVQPVARFGRWPYGECGCGCLPCKCSGPVIGTELGLAIEDCEGVQVEITL